MFYIQVHFDDYEDTRILFVDCLPSRSPVYLTKKGVECLYIRSVAATEALKRDEDAQSYTMQRFQRYFSSFPLIEKRFFG